MLKQIKQFLKNESGAAAVEYGLITSGISVAIIPSVTGVGNKLATIFTQVPKRSLSRGSLAQERPHSLSVDQTGRLRAPVSFWRRRFAIDGLCERRTLRATVFASVSLGYRQVNAFIVN